MDQTSEPYYSIIGTEDGIGFDNTLLDWSTCYCRIGLIWPKQRRMAIGDCNRRSLGSNSKWILDAL